MVSEAELKERENKITLIIKNDLTNLKDLFSYCETLYNFDELKYLNTSHCTNFSRMFNCLKISNIKALEEWDVSNCNSFKGMLASCSSLKNIKALRNWNVSNCKNLSNMFYFCESLSDIKAFEDGMYQIVIVSVKSLLFVHH